MEEQLVGEGELAFHKRRVRELEAAPLSFKRVPGEDDACYQRRLAAAAEAAARAARAQVQPQPPGERSGIRLTGRGDGLTTRVLDALTGEDLVARYGICDVTLKTSGENWSGVTLLLELNCPVIAELSGCWPGDIIS